MWLAIALPQLHRAVRILFAVVAAGLYVLEFIFTAIRHAKAKPGGITRNQVALYYGAHLSVINFALDMCSNGIKMMRLQHIFFIAVNAVSVIILYVGLQYIDAYERAWGCYPAHERQLKDFYRGMCPQWERYYGPIKSHSDSNREHNLACRDFGKLSRACMTEDVDTSLPVIYHIVSLMVTVSFSLSISLVRYKLREIKKAEEKQK